jgi:hypothetical protein
MRRHKPSRHHSYMIDAGDGGRDVRIFLSSLIIGICIGAFGVYFWVERPHTRQLTMLQAELNTALSKASNCTTGHSTTLGQREELESRLATCTASLNRARQNVTALASGEDASAPPVPKPPPGRTSELSDSPPSDAAEAALALPVSPAPVVVPPPDSTSPHTPQALPPGAEPVPPNPFTPPTNWPPLPKAPSTSGRSAAAPEPVASPAPETPAAEPEVAPPALTEPTPPAPAWPDGFPPQPRSRPTPPPAPVRSETAAPEPAAPETAATLTPLRGSEQVTLNVGEERSITEGRQLRLIAVSRRNSGRFCVVGGNGMASVRVPSGGSARATWGGQRVVLNASAQDGDTCRVSVRPQ